MAISGIGAGIGLNILPTRQDLTPASERGNTSTTRQADSGSGATQQTTTGQTLVNPGTRFDPTSAGNQLNANSQDRRNPADIEALRNQFGLQSDNAPASPNRAISSFIAVAQFEQRDEISSTTGIDIVV